MEGEQLKPVELDQSVTFVVETSLNQLTAQG